MSTEFTAHLPPPGEAIRRYDRTLSQSQQPSSVPQVFLDAMFVREQVFVNEQEVPLEHEVDEEDAISHHMVAYASVGQPRNPDAVVHFGFNSLGSPPHTSPPPSPKIRPGTTAAAAAAARRRSQSTATRLPVGVLRIIPPHYKDYSPAQSPALTSSLPIPTRFPGEPYIRIGRLATLKDYRGLGLSKLLVNNALQYARQNPKVFEIKLNPAVYEERRQHGLPPLESWKGLVYVHAQKERTVPLWKRWGFLVDEGMGTWDEEGTKHVGMWKRLELPAVAPAS